MALPPGTRVGPYEVVAPIGAGGMGEVYRATDTKLKRQVAIKILPPSVAGDVDRLARFQREAEVLASLNHPNIAAIFGLEESRSTGSGQAAFTALVMELVEGEDLSQRIARGAIPIDEARPIARQIAAALEAAHEQGIIHRDLKPANIKVRADGTVKVLDFGLAKALDRGSGIRDPGSAEAANSPTLSIHATQAGMILGTAAYMAPEQARGKTVDKRADIWAFGAVLFEMLTGTRAFGDEDVSLTLSKVLQKEPDWRLVPKDLSPTLLTFVKRCLQKNPKERIGDIHDVCLALDGAFETTIVAPSPEVRWTRTAAFTLAAVSTLVTLAVVGVGVWTLSRARSTASVQVARLAITLPDDQRFGRLEFPAVAAVSPDGTQVAYVAVRAGREQLFIRQIDGVESKALAGTEAAMSPFFSPDGQWIGFFAQGKLKKISVASGTTQTLCDASNGRGGSWSGDTIYFAAVTNGGISKVSADGGAPIEVTTLDRAKGEISHREPHVLPGGRALLFTVWLGPGADERQVHVQRLDGGERAVVVPGGQSSRYVRSGHVIYTRNDDLLAMPFDVDRLRVSGQASRLSDAVRTSGEGAHYAVSDNGVFASVSGSPGRYQRRLVWVGRDGRVEPLPAPPREYYGNAAISPDGRRAAVDIAGGTIGIWIYDFARATLTPLTTGQGSSQAPRWTPDGTRLVYRGTRTGYRNLWWKLVDDASPEARLTTGEGTATAGSWSSDGKWLAYYDTAPGTGLDVWALPSGGDRTPRAVVQTPFAESNPRLSPDGRWLAYVSDESGRNEVVVQAFPTAGGRTQISTGGGNEPVWSRDGRELFFLDQDAMMVVEVRTAPAFSASAPRKLYEGRFLPGPNTVAAYDVSADGQRFLRVQPMHPDPPTREIQVTLNWFEELKRLAPTK